MVLGLTTVETRVNGGEEGGGVDETVWTDGS